MNTRILPKRSDAIAGLPIERHTLLQGINSAWLGAPPGPMSLGATNAQIKRKELSDSWGAWLDTLADWDWFLTMTFDDKLISGGGTYTKPGWAYAKRAFNEFLKASRPAIDDRKWVRVFEIQRDRGGPHIHALLTESADSPRRMHMVDWCKANFGIARIFQYQRGLGAAHYLGKYLVKDHGAAKDNFDIDFSETLDIERVM